MCDEFAGGLIVCRPEPLQIPRGGEQGIRVIGDLHVGAASTDHEAIDEELEDGARKGDRFLIVGDVSDGIFPGDKKRFRPSVLHPRLRGRDDIANALLDWEFELLAPRAHLIDVILSGNHDDALTKHHNFDLVLALVDRLNKHLESGGHAHRVWYGGYCCFVCYKVANCPGRGYNVFAHHGFGKGKGRNDYERLHWIEGVDLICLGHLHAPVSMKPQRISPPASGFDPVSRTVRMVRTGAYMHSYKGQTQEGIRRNGGLMNYGSVAAHDPHENGGARVILRMGGRGLDVKVTQ